MKNVAFIGIATPIVLGILQKEYTTSQVMTMPYNVNSLPHSFEKLTGRSSSAIYIYPDLQPSRLHKLNSKQKITFRFINMQEKKGSLKRITV